METGTPTHQMNPRSTVHPNPDVAKMLGDVTAFVENWLPHYQRDNRSYLTVAIGCTGGQHRSVYLTEKLAANFRGRVPVLVRHRQLS